MSSRRGKKGPQKDFGVRLASGEAPGIDFGASGGQFWILWGSILDQFGHGFGWLPATRCDRDAPNSNRRRGRVAPEQGYRRECALAVSILGRPSPFSPCSSSWSCRSASGCSCCSRCSRLACNACTLSRLTRFPLHDSQVYFSRKIGPRGFRDALRPL